MCNTTYSDKQTILYFEYIRNDMLILNDRPDDRRAKEVFTTYIILMNKIKYLNLALSMRKK